MYSTMKGSSASNGKLKILFKHTLMDAEMNIDVNFLMAGRSKNIIHKIIRCMPADKEKRAQSLTVHTFILIKIKGIL